MTRSQAIWLASVVALLEVLFLQAGARLTRQMPTQVGDGQGRGAAIAWLATGIAALGIPFAVASALRLSSTALTVRAALVTSAGVVLASIAWFAVGRLLSAHAAQPSDATLPQLLWRTVGYGVFVVIAVRLLLGLCAPVQD